MPAAGDWHPEFGYLCPSAGLRRRLRLAVAALAFGLMAGASGMAVLIADHDSNPLHALALAPPEAASEKTIPNSTGAADVPAAPAVPKSLQAEATKPPCRENTWEYLDGNCASGKAGKARTVHAPAQPPAIAAIAIGHREGPAVLSLQPTMPVAPPPDAPDGAAKSGNAVPAADAAPAAAVKEADAPAVSAKKRRKTASRNQVRHRDHGEYSSWATYDTPYHQRYDTPYRQRYAYPEPPIVFWR